MTNKNFERIKQVVSGNAIGQMISLISLPILTRIYGAHIIGAWSLLVSVTAIINSFSDLGLTDKIMVEKNSDKIVDLYILIKNIIIIIAFACVVINMSIFNFFKPKGISLIQINIMLFINILLTQFIQVNTVFLNKKKKYKVLMKNPMINNFTFSFFSILLGFYNPTIFNYLISYLIGQLFTLVHLQRYVPKRKSVTINEQFKLLKESKRFIFFQMPAYIVLQLKSQLPTLLVKMFYGENVLGYYSLAYRILNMPVTLLGNAIGKVFFQSSSEKYLSGKDISTDILNIVNKVSMLSILPIALIISFSDVLMKVIFGTPFVVSGNIMKFMVFYSFFFFLSMATNGISTILKKQELVLISGVLQIISFYTSFYLGHLFFDSLYVSLLLMSLTYSMIQIWYFYRMFIFLKIPVRNYLKTTISSLTVAIIIGGILGYIFRGGIII